MKTTDRRSVHATRSIRPRRRARWVRRLTTVLASLALTATALVLAPASASATPAPPVPPTGNVVLDPSFTGGVDDFVLSLARQSDGRIIVLGRDIDTWELHLTRLLPTGEPDPSFTSPEFEGEGYMTAWVTVQPDDKLLVSGDVTLINGIKRPGLVRLNADGTLDAAFAPIVPGPKTFRATGPAALQADGKVLVAGYVFPASTPSEPYNPPEMVIARFTSSGSHDTGFSVRLVTGGYGFVPATIVPLPDGRMYILGDFAMVNEAGRNGIARLTSTGEVDPTFLSGGGFAARPCPECPLFSGVGARTMAVQTDGKVVVGGTFSYFNWVPTQPLVRLNTDGSRDMTFDTGTSLTMTGTHGSGAALAAAGPNEAADTPVLPQAILPNELPIVLAIEAQPDGKVLVGGVFGSYRGTQRPGIVRINGNGSVDLTFDPGAGFSGQANPSDVAVPGMFAMLELPDGRILAGGNFMSFDQQPASNLAALMVVPQQPAEFTPLPTPVRVFDSRSDLGAPFYGTRAIDVTKGGAVELPEAATAVAVNLTVTGQTASGYASLDRDDGRWFPPSCPSASAINWTGAKQTIANATTIGISGEKKIKVCVMGSGQAHVLVDVLGYYAPPDATSGPEAATSTTGGTVPMAGSGALFVPTSPVRAYDSRITGGAITGGSKRTLDLAAGAPGALPAGATALAYNLTITGTTGTGFLAVAPGGTATAPTASTVNWTTAGQTIANAAQTGIVDRKVEVFAGGGSTHFTLDVVGYFAPAAALPAGTTGLAYLPIAPTRAYDSRTAGGPLAGNPVTGGTGAGRTTGLTLGGALPPDTGAITMNLTATGTTGSGFLASSPSTTPPASSIVNWTRPGATIANGTPIGVGTGGAVTTWAGGRQTSQYLIDITGYYTPADQ